MPKDLDDVTHLEKGVIWRQNISFHTKKNDMGNAIQNYFKTSFVYLHHPSIFHLTAAGLPCFITGWGRYQMTKKNYNPKILQVLKTLIIDATECERQTGEQIRPLKICTGLKVLNKAPCMVCDFSNVSNLWPIKFQPHYLRLIKRPQYWGVLDSGTYFWVVKKWFM